MLFLLWALDWYNSIDFFSSLFWNAGRSGSILKHADPLYCSTDSKVLSWDLQITHIYSGVNENSVWPQVFKIEFWDQS